MSNGNMLLGYARGKVGSLVFSRNKGKQVTAAYNSSPANPRSESQMTQRATFLGVQKFFTKGRQAFFRFAFEDKKTKESEFAAFMRNNIKRGVMLSQEAFNNATYPAIGKFIMTKGSLGVVQIEEYNDDGVYVLNLPGLTVSSNFGDLSQALINRYGVQNGDLITICFIRAHGSDISNTPAVYPADRGTIDWSITQAVLDNNSTSSISSKLNESTGPGVDCLHLGAELSGDDITGCCVVISRQTRRGLKVSTSYLKLNSTANTAYETAQSPDYISAVLESWNATPQAILQGQSDQ